MSKYDKITIYDNEMNSPIVEGENIIWSSKPKQSAFLINRILTMLPLALIWLAFDSFFILSMINSGDMKKMVLFLIPFFALHLMPVWIWIGNIISANKRWKNTEYYVTDKRIIIQNGFISENYQTIYYKDIKNVDLHIGIIDKFLHVGDIYFDLGYIGRNNKATISAFLDVETPREVYSKIQKIVLDIQTDIEYPNELRPKTNPGYNTKYDSK